MQRQPYFVVVLAHSLHGRLRRIHVSHKVIYAVVVIALLGGFGAFGMLASYLRMTLKVAAYNSLRSEVNALRERYHELQKVTNQKDEQLASLQIFANEVSAAYGVKNPGAEIDTAAELKPLNPSYRESLEQYNFLQSASIAPNFHMYAFQWQTNIRPTLWPVNGRIMSPFGARTDPLNGEGAMHTGVDLGAAMGTPVHATADGVVVHASWGGQYGNLVIIDHGNGMETYYAHLSSFSVIEGQEIRRGETLGHSGATGRVTAPHLHYEVRIGGTPVNPYKYLADSLIEQPRNVPKDLPF